VLVLEEKIFHKIINKQGDLEVVAKDLQYQLHQAMNKIKSHNLMNTSSKKRKHLKFN